MGQTWLWSPHSIMSLDSSQSNLHLFSTGVYPPLWRRQSFYSRADVGVDELWPTHAEQQNFPPPAHWLGDGACRETLGSTQRAIRCESKPPFLFLGWSWASNVLLWPKRQMVPWGVSKKCVQQVKRCTPPLLLCPSEAASGVLRPVLVSLVQER